MRYELTDHEWTAIKPMLPNKPRGVPRVNDRRNEPICFSPYLHRAPQLGRAVLQLDQAVSSGCDPLRQTRCQLPRLHPACFDQAVVAR